MDPIDQAIAATQAPKPYQATKLTHRLSSGRQVVIAMPADFTDNELHEAIGWVLVAGWPTFVELRDRRAPGLVIPAGPLPSM